MEINVYLVEGKYDIATYQLFQPFFSILQSNATEQIAEQSFH